MLNFVFTIDGDWLRYFDPALSRQEKKPDKLWLHALINKEIEIVNKYVDGKFIHFLHASPVTREFFLTPEFVSVWKLVESSGGSIGVHIHEDVPKEAFYVNDTGRMMGAITAHTENLRGSGLHPIAYRGGYLAFNKELIPLLEENKLWLDFSCEPGRHIPGAADWRGVSDNYYRMAYNDHRKEGESNVFEIPLGEGMYIELTPLWKTWLAARKLKRKAERSEKPIIVSVLAHTYDFRYPFMRAKIRLALLILKRYGRFINADEVYDLVKKNA